MAHLFLLRHFPTDWNKLGKIQGSTDIALSEASRKTLAELAIPPAWTSIPWFTSPLGRARETAQLLGAPHHQIEPALTEMNWGQFEGCTLTEIEQQILLQRITPASGLDLLAPEGESPRMVCERLSSWLNRHADIHKTSMAVTHKGVIRAALSHGTGWDMSAPYPDSIDWQLPHLFDITERGNIRLLRLNWPWAETTHL